MISPEVLARYAVDAAAEVPGVQTKQRRGARERPTARWRCTSSSTTARTSRPSLHDVQRRVLDYLERMTDVRPTAVHVVVDDVAATLMPPRLAA